MAEFILFPPESPRSLSSAGFPLCSANNLHCEHCDNASVPIKTNTAIKMIIKNNFFTLQI